MDVPSFSIFIDPLTHAIHSRINSTPRLGAKD